MAQSKILLDSNSYFRLARGIHPLLFLEFGDESHCLYVLQALEKEFDRSRRLQQQFPWVDEEEYRRNRSKKLSLSRKNGREIQTTFDLIWDHAVSIENGASRVDIEILSHGYVLEIPIVTDDGDMRKLATIFGVNSMKTLELLAMMHRCGHVEIEKVRQIVAYWEYEGDKPTDCHKDYKRLFKEPPP